MQDCHKISISYRYMVFFLYLTFYATHLLRLFARHTVNPYVKCDIYFRGIRGFNYLRNQISTNVNV